MIVMISIALAVLYSSCTISLASRCYDSVHYTPLKGLDSHDSISSWHVASANAAPNYHLIQLRSSRYGDMSLTTEVPSAAATKGASRLSARSRSTGTSVFDYGDVSPSVANILLASKMQRFHLRTTRGLWDSQRWGKPPLLDRNRHSLSSSRSYASGSSSSGRSTMDDWTASVSSPDGTVLMGQSAYMSMSGGGDPCRDSASAPCASHSSSACRCKTNNGKGDGSGGRTNEDFTMRQAWNRLRELLIPFGLESSSVYDRLYPTVDISAILRETSSNTSSASVALSPYVQWMQAVPLGGGPCLSALGVWTDLVSTEEDCLEGRDPSDGGIGEDTGGSSSSSRSGSSRCSGSSSSRSSSSRCSAIHALRVIGEARLAQQLPYLSMSITASIHLRNEQNSHGHEIHGYNDSSKEISQTYLSDCLGLVNGDSYAPIGDELCARKHDAIATGAPTVCRRRCHFQVHWDVTADLVMYDSNFSSMATNLSSPSDRAPCKGTCPPKDQRTATHESEKSVDINLIRPREHILNELHASDATRISVGEVLSLAVGRSKSLDDELENLKQQASAPMSALWSKSCNCSSASDLCDCSIVAGTDRYSNSNPINLQRAVQDSSIYNEETLNRSVTVRVTEIEPPHVDLILSTYNYRILCNNTSDYELGLDGTYGWHAVYDTPGFAIVDGIADAGIRYLWTHEHLLFPGCGLELQIDGKKRLLTRETMPGDASRGIEVPPLIVMVTVHAASTLGDDISKSHSEEVNGSRMPMYVLLSDSFIVTLPIPDASMPFNVLTLTSTVAAFLLGSMVSALVKKSQRVV